MRPDGFPDSVGTLLDAVYQIDVDTREWQKRIGLEIFHRHPIGTGLLSYEFDASAGDGHVRIGSAVDVGHIPEFRALTDPVHNQPVGAEYARAVAKGTHAGTTRELLSQSPGFDLKSSPFIRSIQQIGYHDIWAVCCVNPDARGIVFAVPYAEPRPALGVVERDRWTRLGVHIAAAERLRRRLGAGVEAGGRALLEQADAVLNPDGRVCNLTDSTVSDRDALSGFVKALDSARAGDARGRGDDLLSLWQGLLRGRWSVFDQVDTDGRRYVVAFENDPDAAGPRRLSRRQRQVATYAAQGHTNKVIAYELGITTTTVATHLRGALSKLRLSRRTDLVWLYGQLVETQGITHSG